MGASRAGYPMLGWASLRVVAALAVLTPGLNAFAAPATPPTTADAARRAVTSCGLPEHRIRVSYERELQADIIRIASDPVPLAEPVLACMARASLKTGYFISFLDEAERSRYWPLYFKFGHELEVADARDWLQKRDLLKTMPLPQPGKPLADYTRAVESFCGARPESLLSAPTEGMITWFPEALGRVTANGYEPIATTTEQFGCVVKVIKAADLESRGIAFGFIGNAPPANR